MVHIDEQNIVAKPKGKAAEHLALDRFMSTGFINFFFFNFFFNICIKLASNINIKAS